MELNAANLNAMRTAFNLKFKDGVEGYTPCYKDLAMIEGDIAHDAIEFPFLEQLPGFREWIGDRQFKTLGNKTIRVKEKSYEASVKIPRRAIETDSWGVYGSIIAQMGEAGEQLWDELMISALTNPTAWLDGKAFYSPARKYGSDKSAGTINNTAELALSFENFGTFFTQMATLTGSNGKPLNSRPTHLIVGPALEDTARIILNQETYRDKDGNEVLNPHKGKVQLKVHPLILGEYAQDWYLGKFDAKMKPLLVLKNKEAELVTLAASTDENVFMRDEIVYGSSAYGNAAALFPHLLGRSRPA